MDDLVPELDHHPDASHNQAHLVRLQHLRRPPACSRAGGKMHSRAQWRQERKKAPFWILTILIFLAQKMRAYQKKHMLKRMPSLLEMLGFALFLPSFLAGPTMEMSDYLDFISGDMFKVK